MNRFDDRAWAAQAEQICARAEVEREALIDLREVDGDDPAMLAERAGIVDRATDVLDRMLDDVVAVPPTDPKGRELVPRWEADYRTYLADRREFTARLRQGENEPFTETALDGIPISDKLEVFAGDNEMPSCAPPHDRRAGGRARCVAAAASSEVSASRCAASRPERQSCRWASAAAQRRRRARR